MLRTLILFMGAALMAAPINSLAEGSDYSHGVFIVNEDWYGHQNSTLNYLDPAAEDGEYWQYRVIQKENPGMELGCTNQFGAIWKGRMYLIAKQSKDPGAEVIGGRITVADASTLKILYQSENIDPEGGQCDGRGFVGVNDEKGYISSSNGIWIFDLKNLEITGKIDGTENTTGSLYSSQCGNMVMSEGMVFAAHQSKGIIVINPADDSVVKIIGMEGISSKAGVGSVVKDMNGDVWASVTKDTSGSGAMLNMLLKIDPVSLESEIINLPEGVAAPSSSWYAWTPDSFCASAQNPVLYWSGGRNSWFSSTDIYRYDISDGEIEKIIDLEEDGEGWKLYGCSMRVDPRSDEIYMSLYREFNSPVYITRRYSALGEKLEDYHMIENYWFPSLPVFPEETTGAAIPAIYDNPSCESEAEYFTMSGIRITSPAELTPGMYIKRTGGKSKKILITQ
ncbi:MAG: DUF5074 domain-containing protein [Muribaculaceae bacterium]|nr:DUF5074 domain-containing protein [Muribaculaceae bacterium]